MSRHTAMLTTAAILLMGCAALPPTDPCPPHPRMVTLHQGATGRDGADVWLKISPARITVTEECPLEIRITPANVAPGKVRTRCAEPANCWLDGQTNDEREEDRILVTAPAVDEPTEYKYSIEVEGVGTLDPHVRVEPY